MTRNYEVLADGGLAFPDLGVEVPRARAEALEIAADALRCGEQLRRAAVSVVAAAINPATTRGHATHEEQLLAALTKVITLIDKSRLARLEGLASQQVRNLEIYEQLKAFLDDVVKSLVCAVTKERNLASLNSAPIEEMVQTVLSSSSPPECLTWDPQRELLKKIHGWLVKLDADELHSSRVNTSKYALLLVGQLRKSSAKAVLDGNTSARRMKSVEPESYRVAYEVLKRTPRNVR